MPSINEFQKIFLDYLQDNAFEQAPQGLYQPVDYMMQLGGKRLRPVLVLLSYHLFRDDFRPALPVALAMEVFHNFSLVHDDIMDEAPLRRGQATVHHRYGLNTGILSGDVMLILCYKYLVKVENSALIPALVETFNEVAIKVCEGQQYDMDFETKEDVTIAAYLKMIEYKTAALIEGCMGMGGILAEAGAENIAHLKAFGRNIGLAFQMQDDILDTFGDPDKFGKKVGGDILNNKKTYLILKAYELAGEADRQRLKQWMRSTTESEAEKINAVTQLLIDLNIQDLAMEKMISYQETAFKHLAQVKASAEKKQILLNLAEALLVREV
ncbi:MAG: polyprenyl synthetase family protein [Saprospiraceae bacterium]